MKKILFILLFLVFLIGCQLSGFSNPYQDTTQTTYEEFRTGNEGLVLQFTKNMPPPQLYDSEPFATIIEIANKGTHTVGGPGDKIYLSGFDSTIIQGIPMTGKQIPTTEGKSRYVTEPGIGMVDFRGTIRDISSLRMDKYPVIIAATACYGYETIATIPICIDPDPYSITNKQKVCTPETALLVTQGAPIAVEEVEILPSKGTTRFRIHIRNAGYGDVFRNGVNYLDKCNPHSPGLNFDEIDYVQLGDVSIAGINIKPTCKPLDSTGHIKLTNGEATILCELSNIRGQTPYTTTMNLVLRYGYRNSIFTETEIHPVD